MHLSGNNDGDGNGGDDDSAGAAHVECYGLGEGDEECSVGTCLLCEAGGGVRLIMGVRSAGARAASDQNDCHVGALYLSSSCGP